MKHSTGKPTKRESEYIERCKTGPCVACYQWEGECNGVYGGWVQSPCDFNHCKSGNIRRGHMYGYGLCKWHHMRHPLDGRSHSEMGVMFGPSLMDGSRLFRLTYGSDDDLIALQRELIGWEDDYSGA